MVRRAAQPVRHLRSSVGLYRRSRRLGISSHLVISMTRVTSPVQRIEHVFSTSLWFCYTAGTFPLHLLRSHRRLPLANVVDRRDWEAVHLGADPWLSTPPLLLPQFAAARIPSTRRNLKRATLAASVGSALEYYDFALYSLASALIFGKIFFPGLGDAAGTVASLGTLAIGFLARPIGGLFFGTLGDKLGRKWVLMITIALMGGSSFLIGVLPTADQIGVWAPLLLVFLRICQGFGAGAEQAGATVLMAEYSPTRRRGFFSALPFVGIMLGTLLASLVFVGLGQVPEEALLGWVWRIPFLASILLIGVAVLIRLRLQESPTFVKLEKQDQVAEHPLGDVFRKSAPSLLRGIGLRMAENGGSYIYQTLAITYVSKLGVQTSIGPLAVAIGAILGFFTIPLAGALSDKYGRMKVYRVGAIVQLAAGAGRMAAAVHGQRLRHRRRHRDLLRHRRQHHARRPVRRPAGALRLPAPLHRGRHRP